ncbi:MAG TPA: UDP-3-O-(3-hydroxymyristoyl)glucosamine N-acyltransferase [Paludibacteraceae bacterium]|nr:UDP-3-O-(3-hydroxymyristoyl)glucosamine N-acyltransferase [Paludibacteraceae bacterium]
MEFTAQQIADFLGGEIEGNPSVKVSGFSKIEEGKPGTLTFLSNPKYNHYLYDCKASIVLINKDFKPEKKVTTTLIRVDNAYELLAKLFSLINQNQIHKKGISSLAYIAPTAQIGENVYIAPFVFIGENVKIGKNSEIYAQCAIEENSTVGENVILYPGVKIYHNCVIGNNCILHGGVVIGADGFGFAQSKEGIYEKIFQLGNVVLEDDIEVGANSTIDRATLGSTIIHKGVKIDNLVQIAHNVEIGENTVIVAQTGIAGSTKIGKNCVLAGQVGIVGHLQIADNTQIGAQSGVTNSVKTPGQIIIGSPAIPIRNFRRSSILFKNLPEIQNLLIELKNKVEKLEKNIQSGNSQ